jgi:hypothetical protein
MFHMLRAFSFVIGLLAFLPSVALRAQAPNSAGSASVGFGAGIHGGSLGGVGSNGPALAVVGWFRALPAVAARIDAGYAYNSSGGIRVCAAVIGQPCPSGGPSHVSSLGTAIMVGDLDAPATSSSTYLLLGAELLYARGRGAWQERTTTVPKLGAGLLLSRSLFVELTGRWRSEWEGWRVRHLVLLFGVRR